MIRDVVTRGFGNGTFSPGVNALPVRGYSISALAAATHFSLASMRTDYTLRRIPQMETSDEKTDFSLGDH